MKTKFPLYIISKGRYESRFTSKALEKMKVPYYIVIEEQEYNDYAKVIDPQKIIILLPEYQNNYERLCDETLSAGPGAARNFVWQHSILNHHSWHWVMDDNITEFYRLDNNLKHRVRDGAIFNAMEDFCLRYTNVAMAGPNYEMFVPRKTKVPPFICNTRIYSCSLIRNDVPFKWRGRYNEDVILSLDMLKAGWCTIQFNAFLQNKMGTQILKGGNTDEFYAKEGTYPKSKMLVDQHPDVSKLAWRFGRCHHFVDYRPFKKNKLRKKKNLKCDKITNNYGMKLKKVEKFPTIKENENKTHKQR